MTDPQEGMTVLGDDHAWARQPVPVSAAFISYNQRAYVRQALESVLRQTYPLDIVVSDDGSTDGTQSVIRDLLGDYRGPHALRLRFGGVNLGVCRNQNVVLSHARGELVVLFEGDDVSAPNRVERLVSLYVSAGRSIAAIGSGIRRIDGDGRPLEEVVWPLPRADARHLARNQWTVQGCGLAIRRDVYTDLGPIARRLISGDIALWLRGAFVERGGLGQVQEVLVDYRIHQTNVGNRRHLDPRSPSAFRESCRRLIGNEVAQLRELKNIARYRASRELADPPIDKALHRLLVTATLRARLAILVALHAPWRWLAVACRGLAHAPMRGFAKLTIRVALIYGWGRLFGHQPRGAHAFGSDSSRG